MQDLTNATKFTFWGFFIILPNEYHAKVRINMVHVHCTCTYTHSLDHAIMIIIGLYNLETS